MKLNLKFQCVTTGKEVIRVSVLRGPNWDDMTIVGHRHADDTTCTFSSDVITTNK